MTSVIQYPEDVANLALTRIGFKGRIGSIYEGSVAAKKVLDVYSQTRDEVLMSYDWGFAERTASLTLLKQAPAGGYAYPNTWNATSYPAPPWQFSYAYPSDCLKVRAIKPVPLFLPNFSPVYNKWDIADDQTETPVVKVILTNVANAVMVYTGQVTLPSAWEANFVEAFAAALGQRLAPSLVELETTKLAEQDAAQQMAVAETEQG